jgi:hypothetical protein
VAPNASGWTSKPTGQISWAGRLVSRPEETNDRAGAEAPAMLPAASLHLRAGKVGAFSRNYS